MENLVKILEEKKSHILGLKRNLDEFKMRLQEEQVLSVHCQEKQAELEPYQTNGEATDDGMHRSD